MLLETSVVKSNVSFTVNFRGFSYFESETGKQTSSPIADLGGYRWSVSIYPGGDKEESKGYLSCFLKHESQAEVKASHSITLVSRYAGKDSTYEGITTFKPLQSRGYAKFISIEELKSPLNLYYNNDTIVIRVNLDIYGALEKKVLNAPWTDTHITNSSPRASTFKNDLSSMLFNPLCSDITIHVGEERLPAHHFVLALRSEVFRAMFSSNMIEATERAVHIDDFDLPVVKAMLRFLYSDDCEDHDLADHGDQLLAIACKYGISGLVEKVESHLSSTLTITNAAKVLKMADMCNAQKLKSSALKFIAQNLKAISQTSDFLEVLGFPLTQELMLMLVESEGPKDGKACQHV